MKHTIETFSIITNKDGEIFISKDVFFFLNTLSVTFYKKQFTFLNSLNN
jgi:hypothetical protein